MTIQPKALLLLKNIQIENANAVAGLTYGFPAITHFLGFTHALSRYLTTLHPGWQLRGCAVVSHQQQLHAHSQEYGNLSFSLSRNPLTKDEKPSPFIPEGRMHLNISLLIECLFDVSLVDADSFKQIIEQWVVSHRLAGGIITHLGKIILENIPEDFEQEHKFTRRMIHQLLPGYTLIERSQALTQYWQQLQLKQPQAEQLDAWLDFISLRSKAQLPATEPEIGSPAKWRIIPKPVKGYLVPIMTGYRAISEIYPPNVVHNVRDKTLPCRFVEGVYTIGQWLSPHRIQNLEEIFWRYTAQPESGWYLCRNEYEQYNKTPISGD